METKAIRRKLRQIEDIVEDVEYWLAGNLDELTPAAYEVDSLERKLRDITTLAAASGATLHTIETLTEKNAGGR